jgi:sRNA-binding carbon storage regulator CsrA
MLVLTRKDGDALVLECQCGRVSRVIVRGATVQLAVDAAREVKVLRGELACRDGSPGQSESDTDSEV